MKNLVKLLSLAFGCFFRKTHGTLLQKSTFMYVLFMFFLEEAAAGAQGLLSLLQPRRAFSPIGRRDYADVFSQDAPRVVRVPSKIYL